MDMCVSYQPYLYVLFTPGIMEILVKFEGDVTYEKLNIPDVQDTIPDDLRS